MAVVPMRRRRRVGLGDLSEDMHNAAMSAEVTSNLPFQNVPYLKAYRYAGQTFINMDESGETPNWVSYTDAHYGVTEQEKAAVAAAQGVEVALPGWDAQRAANDPAGYQAALAAFRASTAQTAADVKARQDAIFAAERDAQAQEAAAINRAQLERDVRASLAGMIASGGVFADTIKPGGYTRAFLEGMLTTDEWVQDEISAAMGGPRTNATRMRGRVPSPLPPGVFIIDGAGNPIGGDIPPGYTGPTSKPTTTPTTPTTSGGGGTVTVPQVPAQPVAPTSGGGGQALPTYTPPGYGGSYVPPTSGGGGSFSDANDGSSSGPVYAPGGGGPGFDVGGGGAAAPSDGGGLLSSPIVLGGLALAALMFVKRR